MLQYFHWENIQHHTINISYLTNASKVENCSSIAVIIINNTKAVFSFFLSYLYEELRQNTLKPKEKYEQNQILITDHTVGGKQMSK